MMNLFTNNLEAQGLTYVLNLAITDFLKTHSSKSRNVLHYGKQSDITINCFPIAKQNLYLKTVIQMIKNNISFWSFSYYRNIYW